MAQFMLQAAHRSSMFRNVSEGAEKVKRIFFQSGILVPTLLSLLFSCTNGIKKDVPQSTPKTNQIAVINFCGSRGVYSRVLRYYQEDMLQVDRIKTEGSTQVLLHETDFNHNHWTFEVKDTQNPRWGALFKFYKMVNRPAQGGASNGQKLVPPPYFLDIIWNDPSRPTLSVYFGDRSDNNHDLVIEAFKILTKGVDILSHPPFSRVANYFLRAHGMPDLYPDHESLETTLEIFEGKVKNTGELCKFMVHKSAKGDVFKVGLQTDRQKSGITFGAFFLVPFVIPSNKSTSCFEISIGSKAVYLPEKQSFRVFENQSIESAPDSKTQHPLETNVTEKISATQKTQWLVQSSKSGADPQDHKYEFKSIEFCGSKLQATRKQTWGSSFGFALSMLNIKNEKIECEDLVLKTTHINQHR